MSQESDHVAETADAATPYWVPEGEFYEHLPENVKRAVCRVLNPAYRQLVLEAPDELQRSAGLTLVQLIWLEICDQLELGQTVADRESILALAKDPEVLLGRHLRLVAAKCKATELLMKVRMFSKMMGPFEGPRLSHSSPADERLLPREQPKLLREEVPPQGGFAEGDSPIFASRKSGQSPAPLLREGDSPIFAARKSGQSPAYQGPGGATLPEGETNGKRPSC